MIRYRLLVLLAVAASGCSDSFVVDAGVDAGADGGADAGPPDLGHDGGPPDLGIRDLGTYDGPEDCSEIAGYRRCDERCPRPCESPARCRTQYGLCIVRPPTGDDSCSFTALSPEARQGGYCQRGGPCLVSRGDGSADQKWSGLCLDADVCSAAEGRGLPPFTCRYADGSVVVTGPPDAPCPPSAAGAPFCGGSCGMAPDGCPNTYGPFGTNLALSCIGLADTRAYGVCVFSQVDCDQIWTMFGADGVNFYLDACAASYGAPCACMQLAAGPEGPLSYFVKADACVGYRAAYPASVECLDVTRTPLP